MGLLCAQVDALIRPSMIDVHAMLLNSPTSRIIGTNSTTSPITHSIHPSINDETVIDLIPR